VEALADAIHRALVLEPGERRRRLEAIRAHVRVHDVNAWVDTQLAALDGLAATTPR
jgi:trehalose-6-phosphate synthase